MTGGAVMGPAAISRAAISRTATSRAAAGPATLAAQIVVIAKAPVPGRVKTRLTPPFSSAEAAALAEGALCDTLAAVAATPVARRVLALDGEPGAWLWPGFDVIPQRGTGLDERIAFALADAWAAAPVPVVLIGMDTPQVTPGQLAGAAAPLITNSADAAFGFANDGGFWLLGLRQVDSSLVLGVPMSRQETGARQLARLERAGLRVAHLACLTDVDTAEDAAQIAAGRPDLLFSARFRALRTASVATSA
jgi:uncharacterized protein